MIIIIITIPLKSIPYSAPIPVATMIAVGAERLNALWCVLLIVSIFFITIKEIICFYQGQLIIRTVKANINAKAIGFIVGLKRSGMESVSSRVNHTQNVSSDNTKMTGTKYPEILSVIRYNVCL